MSDGIDFEAWNATVRALAGAVDRLERCSRELAAPPWMPDLLRCLNAVAAELASLREGSLAPEPLRPPPSPAAPVPTEEPAQSAIQDTEPADSDDGDDPPPRVAVQFGDPDAIARYGRRRRSPRPGW